MIDTANAMAGVTNPCQDMTTQPSCDNTAECSWVNVPDNKPNTPAAETPLFTKEFCHPAPVVHGASLTENDFADCITRVAATCDGKCMWSNGTDLIPDRDFCAPADLTDDVTVITGCINSIDETTCIGNCKWRRGKQAAIDVTTDQANNQDFVESGAFFSKNFCHPVSTEKWEADASMCLAMKTALTCPIT